MLRSYRMTCVYKLRPLILWLSANKPNSRFLNGLAFCLNHILTPQSGLNRTKQKEVPIRVRHKKMIWQKWQESVAMWKIIKQITSCGLNSVIFFTSNFLPENF